MSESDEDQEQTVIAIVWYRPEQWERVRDISTDSEDFEETYLDWLQQADEKVADLRRTGLRVEKVDVDSEKLVLWCNERGIENDGKARTLYAAETLAESEHKLRIVKGGE